MTIYNAYGDRAPIYIMIGNTMGAEFRRDEGDWNHSATDIAAMVREYVKWDDIPISLQHFAESGVRAYKIATTPPMGPVLLVADRHLQEPPIPEGAEPRIPKLPVTMPPQGDSGAVAEVARLLLQAENPVIALDHATRTQAGVDSLVELAELLQAPVIDKWGRMNFSTRHPLSQSASGRRLIADADLILGLELIDFFGLINSPEDQVHEPTSRRIAKPGAKLISINVGDLYQKSVYQNFQRFTDVDLAIAADVEATVPSLIEAVKRQITAARKTAFQARG